MKIRIAFTIDVDAAERRALAFYYGLPGLASRETFVSFAENVFGAALGSNVDDYEKDMLYSKAPDSVLSAFDRKYRARLRAEKEAQADADGGDMVWTPWRDEN